VTRVGLTLISQERTWTNMLYQDRAPAPGTASAVAYAVPVGAAGQPQTAYATAVAPQQQAGIAMATAVPMQQQQQQGGYPGQQPQVMMQQQQGGYPGQQPQVMMQQQGAVLGAVPQESVGVCRSCGRQFQRAPGASQFSDQWFRCQQCAGIASADFCCTIQ
jgi:hypothetical protein